MGICEDKIRVAELEPIKIIFLDLLHNSRWVGRSGVCVIYRLGAIRGERERGGDNVLSAATALRQCPQSLRPNNVYDLHLDRWVAVWHPG